MGSRLVLCLALLLGGCSRTSHVARCESEVVDVWSREQHRAVAIHPRGCYAAWNEPWSNIEAQRRALLLCSQANPDSDAGCTIIVTDNHVCPISLKAWAKEHSRLDREPVRNTPYLGETEERCELGPAVEVRSAPGTEPPAVDSLTNVATHDVATFFGLEDYDLNSSDFVTQDPLYHVSRGFTAEALHFVERRDGKSMCILRAFSQWDPRNVQLDTLFTVRLLGCFEM